jgi:ribosomal protein L11 methyltransferase
MHSHIKIEFEFLSKEKKEIVVALLAEMNYEGFEEEGDLLKAYISAGDYDEKELAHFTIEQGLNFSVTKVENKNWNQEWESNFHPVMIHDPVHNDPWVAIRAGFHKPIKNVKHEITITPKMSFGTGHHVTTSMMIKMMKELDFTGKTVLDFGTGTGILAILSEKLGASKIIAIDNDDHSIENAKENIRANDCSRIQLLKSSTAKGTHQFDIILANIVKVVILNNLDAFVKQLLPQGVLVLSGLLKDDEKEILQSLKNNSLLLRKKIEEDGWICLQMKYDFNIA